VADKFAGAVAGLTVTERIVTEWNLYCKSPEMAKAMHADLEKVKQVLLEAVDKLPDVGPVLKELLNEVLITSAGGTLQVRSEMSAETLAKLLKLAP